MIICKSCSEPIYDGEYCEACSHKNKIEDQEDYDFSDSEEELEKLFSVLSEKEMMTEESLNELFLDEPYFKNDLFNDFNEEKIDNETNLLKSNDYPQEQDNFTKLSFKKITLSIITVLATIIIFTGIYIGTYLFSLKEADNHYQNKRYSHAYEKLDGMFFYREKDRLLYEKLKIIMTIQHYLDLYSSYNNLAMYPENKNSLIMGLSKYEDIKKDASEIGVLKEVESLKEIILKELENLNN